MTEQEFRSHLESLKMTKEEIKGVMARTFKSHSVNIGGKVKKE
jgi:hypothetical protein